jgi:hypothetical protein
MHKYNRLFFSVLIFLIACKGNKIPDGVLGQDEMTNLLTDIHIVDGGMYNVMQMPDSLYKYGTDKYLIVFKKYHTDSVQFRKSFKYYTDNPEKLEAIYEQITKNIKLKSDSLNKLSTGKIAKDNKRRTDSLNKLPKQAQPKPAITAQPVKPVLNRNLTPKIKPRKRTHADSI